TSFDFQRMAILRKLQTLKLLKLLLVHAAVSLLGRCSSLDEDVFVLEDRKHPEKKIILIETKTDEEPVNCVTLSNSKIYTLLNLQEKLFEICGGNAPPYLNNESVGKNQKKTNTRDEGSCNDSDDCDDQEEQSSMMQKKWGKTLYSRNKMVWQGKYRPKKQQPLGHPKDRTCVAEVTISATIRFRGGDATQFTNDSRFTSRRCFTKDYPLTDTCKTYRSFLKISCKEYERNSTVPKVYLWKTPKRYRKLPLPIVG
ncbi:hypothetical protein JTE90_027171, partial [Oedothorax gibbosus]